MGVCIKTCSVIVFLLSSVLAFGQARPDFFPEVTSPDSSNFEVYSQKSGLSRRANLYNLKKYYSPSVDFVDLLVDLNDGDSILTNFMEFVKDSEGEPFYVDKGGAVFSFGGGSGIGAFDSDRPILRVPTAGVNIGGSTVQDWLNYWYFTAPTLSLSLSPTTTVYEVGDTSRITVSGTVTNSGSATLSNGYLREISPATDTLDSFGATTSYSFAFSFYPQKDSTSNYKQFSYSFAAKQDWVFGAESGTATSSARTVTAVYPVLYGMSATDFSVGGDPYTGLTKLVQAEGDKTVSLTGSGFIYYAVPKTWGDFNLSSIIDHNGFNVTPSFTSYDITVSSTGLVNDWTSVDYKLYKLNTTTTTSGYAYQFNR